MQDWKTCWLSSCWFWRHCSGCWWSKICYVPHKYSTVVEHFVTQHWFKHYVTHHFVSCIQTCGKRCWEELYNVIRRCYDCWRTMVRVLVATAHFSWYLWFTGESMHASELQIATAAQSCNLAPLNEFSLASYVQTSCTPCLGTHCFARY